MRWFPPRSKRDTELPPASIVLSPPEFAPRSLGSTEARAALSIQLVEAIDANDCENVRVLLDKGADPNFMSDIEWPALKHAAAKSDGIEIVRLLLLAGADPNQRDTSLRGTPLHSSCYHGHLDTSRLLVSMGADPHLVQGNGWSTVYCAACRGHAAIVAMLVDCGVDVNVATSTGETPLDVARRFEHPEVVEVLLAANADQKAGAHARASIARRQAAAIAARAPGDLDLLERAHNPLAGDDEQRAAELCQFALAAEASVWRNRPEYEMAAGRIKEIGTRLNETGGMDRMKLVAYRAAVLGMPIARFEFFWNGIGRWRS